MLVVDDEDEVVDVSSSKRPSRSRVVGGVDVVVLGAVVVGFAVVVVGLAVVVGAFVVVVAGAGNETDPFMPGCMSQ